MLSAGQLGDASLSPAAGLAPLALIAAMWFAMMVAMMALSHAEYFGSL